MPYCPQCGYEYEPGKKTCDDCGVPLVAKRRVPSAASTQEEPVVRIAVIGYETLAGVWVDLLQSRGIPCLAKSTGAGVSGWGTAALLPHNLFVRASDKERAVEIMRGVAGGDRDVRIL